MSEEVARFSGSIGCARGLVRFPVVYWRATELSKTVRVLSNLLEGWSSVLCGTRGQRRESEAHAALVALVIAGLLTCRC